MWKITLLGSDAAYASTLVAEKLTSALQQGNSASIKELILDGHGKHLLGRTSWNEEVRQILKSLPTFLVRNLVLSISFSISLYRFLSLYLFVFLVFLCNLSYAIAIRRVDTILQNKRSVCSHNYVRPSRDFQVRASQEKSEPFFFISRPSFERSSEYQKNISDSFISLILELKFKLINCVTVFRLPS